MLRLARHLIRESWIVDELYLRPTSQPDERANIRESTLEPTS